MNTQHGHPAPAGVFTQPFASQLVILALEEAIARGILQEDQVTQDQLEQFLSRSGRKFYKLPDPATQGGARIVLARRGELIPKSIKSVEGDVEIGLSKSQSPVLSLSWQL